MDQHAFIAIGDTHGNHNLWEAICKSVDRNHPDLQTIHVGDAGFWPGYRQPRLDPARHRCIRGNHDEPDNAMRSPLYLGDFGYDETLDLFWVSGAASVSWDVAHRTPGIDWWPEEQLSEERLREAIELYTQVKPACVLSHDGPREAVDLLKLCPGRYEASRTTSALDSMLAIHRPRVWVFGHWHQSAEATQDGCRFICLDEDEAMQIRY